MPSSPPLRRGNPSVKPLVRQMILPLTPFKFYYLISETLLSKHREHYKYLLSNNLNPKRLFLSPLARLGLSLIKADWQTVLGRGILIYRHAISWDYNISSIDRRPMELEKVLTFFFVLFLRVIAAQYSVSVSSPFLLTNNLVNIVTVGTDLQDQRLVSF